MGVNVVDRLTQSFNLPAALDIGALAPHSRIRRCCTLGDSIAAQNLDASSFVRAYRGTGILSWAQALLGQPWSYQVADQFALAGTTTADMITYQLPALRTAVQAGTRYDRCFNSWGTNDFNSGVSLATFKANALTLLAAQRDLGIIPVHWGILPRDATGSSTGQNARRQAIAANRWLEELSYTTGMLEYIPVSEVLVNPADAYGNALAAYFDGGVLHPNGPGAYWAGRAVYDYYKARGIGPGLSFGYSAADDYDAVYCPTGVAFDNPNVLLTGTSGSGVTTCPSGMLAAAGGGTHAWSKQTRTLANGQSRDVARWTADGANTASGVYLYDDCIDTGSGWVAGADEFAPGDQCYGQALVRCNITGGASYPYLQLTETDGASNFNAYCIDPGAGTMPNLPADTYLWLRTPNITIRPWAGSGNQGVSMKVNFGAASAAIGNFEVWAFEVRKVVG